MELEIDENDTMLGIQQNTRGCHVQADDVANNNDEFPKKDLNFSQTYDRTINVYMYGNNATTFAKNGNKADEMLDGDYIRDYGTIHDQDDVISSAGSSANVPHNLRERNSRKPIFPERMRHRRQTLQGMARPLKDWLYSNKTNPYPTKHEKLQLARSSNMSLTQVSNWFANARRRLKNTVKQQNVTWSKRIKLYNKYVSASAELLSVTSSDSEANDDPNPEVHAVTLDPNIKPQDHIQKEEQIPQQSHPTEATDLTQVPSPPKFKQSILLRYLHDTYKHSIHKVEQLKFRSRNLSGSVESHDDLSTSSRDSLTSPCVLDDILFETDPHQHKPRSTQHDEMYWKEISAAMALTSLARGQDNQ